MKTNAGFYVAFFGSFSAKLTAISASLFGSLVFTNEFRNEGDKAKNLISLLFLISNIIIIPVIIGVGYLSDKLVKIWKLLVITNIVVIVFAVLFMMSIGDPGFVQYMGFVMFYTIHILTYSLVIYTL